MSWEPMAKWSEAEWQNHVISLASGFGWTIYHTHDSRRSNRGFPDLALVRERLVLCELKRQSGKPTFEQIAWLGLLRHAGEEVYLFRPSDVDQVTAVLERRAEGRSLPPAELIALLDPHLPTSFKKKLAEPFLEELAI